MIIFFLYFIFQGGWNQGGGGFGGGMNQRQGGFGNNQGYPGSQNWGGYR